MFSRSTRRAFRTNRLTKNNAPLRRQLLQLDTLESRTLMSVVIAANGKSATYTDIDGDLVTVAITKGTLAGANFDTASVALGDQLKTLDISDAAFAGTNVTFTVKKLLAGDGKVNVGYINSTGHDLGNVTIPGDLGRIDAGDATLTTSGLAKLSVGTMGVQALTTQGGAGNLLTNIIGPLGSLVTTGGISNAFINVTGGASGKIGSISITGILSGGAADNSGSIQATGDIGAVKVLAGAQGGDGLKSGAIISSGGKIGAVTLGELSGGQGNNSGSVSSALGIGAVKITDFIEGGGGSYSGSVLANAGGITSLTIATGLYGGNADHSGFVFCTGNLGAVNIAGDAVAGSNFESAGAIYAQGKITSVTLANDLSGGSGKLSGSIFSDGDMGPIKIAGALAGGGGESAGSIGSTAGKVTSASITGNVGGGTGFRSGNLFSGAAMGIVKIVGDIIGGDGQQSGIVYATGKLAGITVTGTLGGGSGQASGLIGSDTDVGNVTITQSINGGIGMLSGAIFSDGGKIANVSIGQSLRGGTGQLSGNIYAQTDLGKVTIGQDLQGSAGVTAGAIQAVTGKLAGVTIKGSLLGGTANDSGKIFSNLDMGAIAITGDLNAGDVGGANTLDGSGLIMSNAKILSVTVNSIGAGTITGTATLTRSAAIIAGNDIGSITVKNGIIGNQNGGKLSTVLISARGQAHPSATADVAIGKISVIGVVQYARILAGYDTSLTPVNADAQIGAITITGNLGQTSIVAGAMNTNSVNKFFGDGNDALISGGGTSNNAGIISKITSITVGGTVSGTGGVPGDAFGIVAENVLAVKIAGVKQTLSATPHTDNLALGNDGDFNILEV